MKFTNRKRGEGGGFSFRHSLSEDSVDNEVLFLNILVLLLHTIYFLLGGRFIGSQSPANPCGLSAWVQESQPISFKVSEASLMGFGLAVKVKH